MAHSSGYITAPVSISDVQQTLSDYSNDLGTLCRSALVNRFAKFKPVSKNKMFTNDELDTPSGSRRPWKSSSTWWKGDAKIEAIPAGTAFLNVVIGSPAAWITICGLKFLGFTASFDAVRVFNPAYNHWVKNNQQSQFAQNFSRVLPSGTLTEPFRLTDFNEYNHYATFPAFTDYDTQTGTAYININDMDTAAHKHTFGLTDAAGGGSSITFGELFTYDASAKFAVVIGKMAATGSYISEYVATVQATATSGTMQATYDFSSQDADRNYLAVYCAIVKVGTQSYYVPLMQSAGDTPNFNFPSSPNAKAYKFIRVIDYVRNLIELKTKNQYDMDYAAMSTVTSVRRDHLYMLLKIDNSESYMSLKVDASSFRFEFVGHNGGVSFTEEVTSSSKRVVFKHESVNAEDWGTSDNAITIPPGTSGEVAVVTCYLALYNILTSRAGSILDTIRIYVNGNTSPMAEYTSLNISIQ